MKINCLKNFFIKNVIGLACLILGLCVVAFPSANGFCQITEYVLTENAQSISVNSQIEHADGCEFEVNEFAKTKSTQNNLLATISCDKKFSVNKKSYYFNLQPDMCFRLCKCIRNGQFAANRSSILTDSKEVIGLDFTTNACENHSLTMPRNRVKYRTLKEQYKNKKQR